MKKSLLLTIALLLPSYPVNAVGLKTASAKLLKCSWHTAKIGGGVACAYMSYLSLQIALIMNRLPPLEKPTGNKLQDDKNRDEYGEKILKELQNLNSYITLGNTHSLITFLMRNKTNKPDLTELTTEQIHTMVNELRPSIHNYGILTCLAFFAAGSSCIWSGAHGLYQELIASDDSKIVDEDTKETTTINQDQ